MNIGYIYKITNNINGKIYIGQTSQTIEARYKKHISDAHNKNSEYYDYPLYRAFRKYGMNNFSVEEVEKCNIEELNEREIYWIAYYNSYYKGYNQTLGGEGYRILDLDEKEVVQKYKELQNIRETAKNFSCSNQTISRILKKHSIQILDAAQVSKLKGNHINQYDLEGNFIQCFQSRTELGKWAIDNNFSDNQNPDYVGASIKHHFTYSDEIEFNGFLLKIEKSLKKDNSSIERKIIYKKEKTPKIPKTKRVKHINTCDNCKKVLNNSSTHLCLDCAKKIRVHEAITQREERYKINREILKQEIRTTPFTILAKKYGVSDNAIRKWCKKYNLPYKSSEIKRYTDEEWEKI